GGGAAMILIAAPQYGHRSTSILKQRGRRSSHCILAGRFGATCDLSFLGRVVVARRARAGGGLS
ncbi:MAG: hypothetical protein ACI9MR_000542, partial [Myxococcota bacterium]